MTPHHCIRDQKVVLGQKMTADGLAQERGYDLQSKFAHAMQEALAAEKMHLPGAHETYSCKSVLAPTPGHENALLDTGRETPGAAILQSPTPLQELRHAARAARAARSSLRRLVAALGAAAGTPPVPGTSVAGTPAAWGDGPVPSLLEALRARAQRDLAGLSTAKAAALPSMPSSSLPPGLPAALPRAPQPAVSTQSALLFGAAAGDGGPVAADLAPRLRLRAGPSERVLSVALAMGGSVGIGGSGVGAAVAVVLSGARVEFWARDPFNWHFAAAVPVTLPPSAEASAVFSADNSCLWVLVTRPDNQGAPAAFETHAQLSLFSCTPMDRPSLVAATPCVGSVMSGPVPLQGPAEVGLFGAALVLAGGGQPQADIHTARTICGPTPRTAPAPWLRLFTWQRPSPPGHGTPAAVGGAPSPLLPPGVLTEAAAFSVARQRPPPAPGVAAAPSSVGVAGLWALAAVAHGTGAGAPAPAAWPGGAAREGGAARREIARQWRLAAWVHEGEKAEGAGELQVLSGTGECLAVLPLESGVSCLAVPSHESCPLEMLTRLCISADPPPFVVITERSKAPGQALAECIVSIAAVDAMCKDGDVATLSEPRLLQLRPLYAVPVPAAAVEVVASSEGLLGCRGEATNYVLDWQQLCTHRLPKNLLPVLVGPSVIVVLRTASPDVVPELVFLEPC
uniref:Uncharacterized protein n=1 Tax=Pyrodinium bahamense TaxID=73915 RepID=A0A7S0BC95_9DINO|mmetsp:Transcript_8954/g.24875  ORF Transcript_8954/g.24875 Transcript_8954/m.24875 type:complete len:682 (+) Transcript_8954:72-2117(+)